MAKVFRAWDVDQGWLLPPSLHEFVPPGHMAHFVRDTVREALDLSAILDTYTEERGYPPYHPGMMVALLLYVSGCETSSASTTTLSAFGSASGSGGLVTGLASSGFPFSRSRRTMSGERPFRTRWRRPL